MYTLTVSFVYPTHACKLIPQLISWRLLLSSTLFCPFYLSCSFRRIRFHLQNLARGTMNAIGLVGQISLQEIAILHQENEKDNIS